MISRLRCRHCGWDNEIPRLRIPRYGARIRCPECGGVQTVLPGQPDAPIRPPEVGESQAPLAPPGSSGETDPAAIRSEARQLLSLWLRELQRDHAESITASHLFRDHSEELAHLYSLWQTSFPGEQATVLFREELISTVGEGAGSLSAAAVNPAEEDG